MMRFKRSLGTRVFSAIPDDDSWYWFDDHQTIGVWSPEESDESDEDNKSKS